MREDNVVLEAEFDRVLEEREVNGRGGRIVGIVQPQHLCAPRHFGGNRGEVGHESVFFSQRQKIRLAAVENASRVIDRVARIGNQHDVAWIDDRGREIRDAFLGADQRAHFALSVEADAEAAPVPLRGRFAKLRQAFVVGIAVILAVVGGALERLDDMPRRGQVRVANREADHVNTLARDLLFQAVKLGKKVGR